MQDIEKINPRIRIMTMEMRFALQGTLFHVRVIVQVRCLL